MKNIFLIIFVFLTPLLASKPIVNVGIYENSPLSHINKNGEASGLFVDILKDITKKKDIKLIFKKCNFDNCLKKLEEGSLDIVGPIVYSHQNSKKFLLLNENIILNMGVVYVKNTSDIDNILNLKNKKVGYLKDDIFFEHFLETLKELHIDVKLMKFNSYDDIFKAIEDDKIDAGIGGRLLYFDYQKKFSDIKISNIIFNPVNMTFAINKNQIELKKFLENRIGKYKIDENSPYYKILNSYLKIDKKSQYFKIIVFLIFVLFSILALLIGINNILKKKIKNATQEILLINENLQKSLDYEKSLNKIINIIKEVNHLLIKNYTLDYKLNKICDTIVTHDLYSLCWIGFIEDDSCIYLKAKSVKNQDYLKENFKVDLRKDEIYKNSVLAKCLKFRKTSIMSIKDNEFTPWKEKALKFDFKYTIASPIFIQKKLKGIIVVHTQNESGFNSQDIGLIEELANDIGLWIGFEQLQEEKQKNYEEIIYSLNSTIEAKDPYTAGHDNRVSEYSEKIAKKLRLSEYEISILKEAAKIHDIGKIKTPDAILLKPGKLTQIEYDIVKEHSITGYEILSKISFLKEEAKIILYHHERYDGSGYPYGLRRDEIPLLSQILSIADTFDAMTTNRIYKKAKDKETAIKELKSLENIWFSKILMEATIDALKDVELDENINQLPLGILEEARFAYFFKDQTTSCYNKNFLKHLFIENRCQDYKYLYTISLKNFTKFNHKFGWDSGDNLLISFTTLLNSIAFNSKIFRLKGDDFILISKSEVFLDEKVLLANPIFDNKILDIKIHKFNIKDIDLKSLNEIIKNL